MFNKNAFRAKVVGAGMTLAEVAGQIGINPATLGRKMSGESDFTRAEIQKMRTVLGMTAADADAIFLQSNLRKRKLEEEEMSRIVTLTPQDATLYLRERGLGMTTDTLRQGIKQGVYPFGLVIELDKSPVYQIFKKQLDAWIAERTVEE